MRRNKFTRTPLSWYQLTRNKARLSVALVGVSLATFAAFVQLAFRDALYDGQTAPYRLIKADLVLINSKMRSLFKSLDFPRQHLYRTLNLDVVESVNYFRYSRQYLYPENIKGGEGVVIFGINPEKPPFNSSDLDRLAYKLNTTGTVLFDRGSDFREYGNIAESLELGKPATAELGIKRVRVDGMVDFAGVSFVDEGNLIMSDDTYFQVAPETAAHSADQITVGLLRLRPGIDSNDAIRQIREQLPDSVSVMTKQEFIEFEERYWATTAPIGFILNLGVFVAFSVGVIIVYQILYNEVSDHLPDYAVLKARGYKHRYFLNVLFQEAFILAILGYLPGLAFTIGTYSVARYATSLPIFMTVSRASFVLLLAIVMCFTSGAISMKKLREADPADLF